MRTTYSISFYCRESKKDRHQLAPLECAISVNGERTFVNLPQKFSPKEFAQKRQPQYIKNAVAEWRKISNEVVTGLLATEQPITAQNIKTHLRTGGVQAMTLSKLWDKFLETQRKKVGVDITDGVYRKYEIAKERCIEHIGDKEISAVTPSDIDNLSIGLRRTYKTSTAGGIMTKVKSIFRWAQRNGMIKTDPTNGLRIDKGQPKTEYLTEAELEQIANTDLSDSPRIERARDILLFQAYGGGMSYVDMCKFNADKMVAVGDYYTYTDKRQKTSVPFTTILLPKAIEILRRYGNHMPFISNQKLNSYAKQVGIQCGIEKNLTSHLFRKSYATMLLAHHIPITTISKCMGHSSPTITAKIYAIAQTDSMVAEFAKAF